MPDDGVIVWNRRDPLFGRTRVSFEKELSERLAGRVSQAWFFGSYVSGGFDRDSDIDLILIVETGKSFTRRTEDFEDLLGIVPTMDILVYTPTEFARLTTDPSPGFWTDAVRTMKRFI